MRSRDIAKSRTHLRNAGAPSELHWLHANLIARLEGDINALQKQKETVRADFRKKLERWHTEEVPIDTPVCAIPTDVRESRIYRLTGVFALACEMALASWIFHRLGVAWWLGCLTALGLTGTLHGAFLHLFDDPDHPRRSIHRIKTFASMPAAFGFFVSLAAAMLARYVSGPMAVKLLPVFSLSLWLGTLSLLVLAASLLTIAHILRWSLFHQQQFRQLQAEEQESAAFLEELRWESVKTHPLTSVLAPDALPARTDGGITHKQGIGFLAVLAVSMVIAAGCSTESAPADAFAQTPENPLPAATLHIYIDWSGSLARPALEEGWSRVHAQLPDIARELHTDRLTVWAFDDEGWSPRQVADLALPTLHTPASQMTITTEWDSFANIRDAIREAEEQERTARQRQAQDAYRAALREALAPLDTLQVLPALTYQTKQSDIVGLLKRLSQTRDRRPQYAIVITDLADTRAKSIPQIAAPESAVRVVILHVPAQPKDALRAYGKALSAAEQYEARARELRDSLPWATLAPYFDGNLAARFNGARTATLGPLP